MEIETRARRASERETILDTEPPSLARRAQARRAQIRILPLLISDGPHQMAADEVMLESAVAGIASLRLYRWNPPTLSLGYFQRHEIRLNDPQLAAMPWIRRATGGGAIKHDNDLTYGIALPAAIRKGMSSADWHCQIHHVLAGILRELAVNAQVLGGRRPPPHELGYDCFAVPQPGDVILDKKKIIGGAQRVRAGALLQHGSIQLRPIDDKGLAEKMVDGLGGSFQIGDWTAVEKARIEELVANKYGRVEWNEKR